jgi:hypothetical protein
MVHVIFAPLHEGSLYDGGVAPHIGNKFPEQASILQIPPEYRATAINFFIVCIYF